MTHCDRIISYIDQNGSITQNDAHDFLACNRLSARIHDLERRGYKFLHQTERGKNRFGEPEHHTRYFLTERPKEAS